MRLLIQTRRKESISRSQWRFELTARRGAALAARVFVASAIKPFGKINHLLPNVAAQDSAHDTLNFLGVMPASRLSSSASLQVVQPERDWPRLNVPQSRAIESDL